jgi:hypothetical protein
MMTKKKNTVQPSSLPPNQQQPSSPTKRKANKVEPGHVKMKISAMEEQIASITPAGPPVSTVDQMIDDLRIEEDIDPLGIGHFDGDAPDGDDDLFFQRLRESKRKLEDRLDRLIPDDEVTKLGRRVHQVRLSKRAPISALNLVSFVRTR